MAVDGDEGVLNRSSSSKATLRLARHCRKLCIVHPVRASLNYVNWEQRKRVATDLKAIYRVPTERQAEQELTEFIASLGATIIRPSARCGRTTGIGGFCFDFPQELRGVIYTTNAAESLHLSLRKIIKTRGSFRSEDRRR